MDRRSLLSHLGIAATATTAGCGTLGFGGSNDSNSQSTVNPEIDGTPTQPDIGEWTLDPDSLSHVTVYGDRLVTVQRPELDMGLTETTATPIDIETTVTGYDTQSGERVYRKTLDGGPKQSHPSGIEYENGADALRFDGQRVVVLDPRTGDTLWSMDQPGTILHRNPGAYYVFRGDRSWDEFRVIETGSWSERCRIEIDGDFESYGNGFIVVSEESAGDEKLTCYETQQGKRLWSEVPDISTGSYYATRRVGDALLLANGLHVESREFESGEQRYFAEPGVRLALLWASDDERWYVGNDTGGNSDDDTGRLLAFDGEDGEVWRRRFDLERASPRKWGEQLYGLLRGEESDAAVRLRPDTGETLWRYDGSFRSIDDRGIYIHKSGLIAAVSTDGDLRWQTRVGFDGQTEGSGYWRTVGDTFLAWTDRELAGLDVETGEKQLLASGFRSLDGLVRHYETDDTELPDNRAFALLDGRIVALSV
jgi:outer membrane protein assembly factor BamB